MNNPLVPEHFVIPTSLKTEDFIIRMLTIHDVIKDYDAVMTSISHLQRTKPFGPNHNWPTKELTLEQDLIDLGWHQKEFQKRNSFAYTVLSLDEKECLGCIYMYPSSNSEYDAEIMLWIRESKAHMLDEKLFDTVKSWVKNNWPYKNPGYPGRIVSWEEWDNLL